MSLRTKLGKRVLGSLIAAAVAVSMLPAMVFADGATGIVDIAVNITSTINANASRDFSNAIRLQAGGSSITDSRFNSSRNATRTSSFSVIAGGDYSGGVITGIEITGVSNTNLSANSYGTGWTLSNGTLSWSGTASNSVSLSIRGNNTYAEHYMSYSTITVHVSVPATGVSVTDSSSAASGYAYVDDIIQLTGTVQPDNTTFDKTLAWSTDDTSGSVEVADGLVSASAAGTYNIIATMTAVSTVSGSYALSVYEHVSGATISDSELEIAVDDQFTLTAVPTNSDYVRGEDYTVTWSTNDGTVATVDTNGVVTGEAEGEAVITATITDNGVSPAATYTADCTVTVLPHLTSIELDPDTLDLTLSSEPTTLTVVYDPEIYGDNLSEPSFESDNESVVTVGEETGVVTVAGEGDATITVSVYDNTLSQEFTATCEVSVTAVHLEGISLDPSSLALTPDSEPTPLTVVYDPEVTDDDLNTPEFISNNEDVVTVSDSGVVTVVGEGTATITVTVYDASLDEEFSASCNVTVSEPAATVTMYRLYNPNSGEHFYTSDSNERNTLIEIGWNNEGIGWIAPASSDTPVYRLYNEIGGEHHYTTSAAERDGLVEAGWRYEGIGWYSADSTQLPVYRQYNPNQFANNHNYTTSTAERDELINLGWRDEGTCWYGVGVL